MRETDRIANEKFGGDIALAINYVIRELGGEEIDNICEEWDKNECEIAANVLADIAIEKHGVRGVRRILRESERQLKHETRLLNPCRSLVLIDLFKLVIVNGCIIVVCLILQKFNLNIDFKGWATVIEGGSECKNKKQLAQSKLFLKLTIFGFCVIISILMKLVHNAEIRIAIDECGNLLKEKDYEKNIFLF